MLRLAFLKLHQREQAHHLGPTTLAPGAVSVAHRHDFFEVFLVERGAGLHHCNDQAAALLPGHLCLVLPDDEHHFQAAADQALCFSNLAVSARWWRAFTATLSPAVSAVQWQRAARTPRLLNPQQALACRRAMLALRNAGPADPTRLPAAMALCLAPLLAPAAGGAQAVPDWLTRWAAGLSQPELLALPLAAWQARSGVSPEHLARSCKRHFGDSPSTLINRARIAWVQSRLPEGAPALDLAFEAGFENVSYFYRSFKRFTGVTPQAWASVHRTPATVPTRPG